MTSLDQTINQNTSHDCQIDEISDIADNYSNGCSSIECDNNKENYCSNGSNSDNDANNSQMHINSKKEIAQGLRILSLLARQMPPQYKQNNTHDSNMRTLSVEDTNESIALAKEALSMDFDDCKSWGTN